MVLNVLNTAKVRPIRSECSIASAMPTQFVGNCSAKVPKYMVVRNDSNFTSDEKHMISYVLSYGHKIISQMVSLPTPLYGANEMAMHGKCLFYAFT